MAQYLDLLGLQHYNTKIQAQLDTKVDKVDGKGLSTNDLTNELLAKLNGIEEGANAYEHPTGDGNLHVPATGTTNAGKVLTAGSTAGELIWKDATAVGVDAYTKAESDEKFVEQETGKGLSTNDLTNELLEKLEGIEEGATAITVDTALSDTSTNPVENKAVKTAIDAINESIETLDGDSHTHTNADVLNSTTASFTTEQQTKLAGIEEGANKTVVDSARSTTSENPVQNKVIDAALTALETDSHTHDNKAVLDATTASFTTEEKTKLAGFGDATTYALKSDIVGIYKYKGSVADQTALPTSGNATGDVYNVEDTGMNYAWTEAGTWDALGMTLTIETVQNSDIDAMFD